MRNKEKIRKQKNSLSSGIIIKLCVFLGVVGLLFAFGASFSAAVGLFAGYKILRLTGRLLGLFVSFILTVISIIILFTIISLLIF
jgi:hypothetical protein